MNYALTIPVKSEEIRNYLYFYAFLVPGMLVVVNDNDKQTIYIEAGSIDEIFRFIEHYKQFMAIVKS